MFRYKNLVNAASSVHFPQSPNCTMPPVRTKRERTLSVQPINIHPRWSDGDFSLISNDGTTFKVPFVPPSVSIVSSAGDLYPLTSKVSLQNYARRRGTPKELTIDDRAATVQHFLQMVQEGKPKFTAIEDFEYIDQVVELAAFLNKYKCVAALYMFFHYIKTVEPVAPLVLFLVGVRLKQSRVCQEAIDQDPKPWKSYNLYPNPYNFYRGVDAWKTPKFVQNHKANKRSPLSPETIEVDMLLPQAMHCSLFLSFPPEYAWALTVGASLPKSQGACQCSGDTFLALLGVALAAKATHATAVENTRAA